MNNSNSSTTARSTLKLKVVARAIPREPITLPNPRPQTNKTKPGARWDDEHKERMQAEMDALAR